MFFEINENGSSNHQDTENFNGFRKCNHINIAVVQEDSDFALHRKVLKTRHVLVNFRLIQFHDTQDQKTFLTQLLRLKENRTLCHFRQFFKGHPRKKKVSALAGRSWWKQPVFEIEKTGNSFQLGRIPLVVPKTPFFASCSNQIPSRFQVSCWNWNPLLDKGNIAGTCEALRKSNCSSTEGDEPLTNHFAASSIISHYFVVQCWNSSLWG